ncbi:MAG TPA: phage terminase large subunit [Blastocatellia bacterium]|nr:phage terminase large subunit [Blastocatellia bacterium]
MSDATSRFATAAFDIGVQRDQLDRFLRFGYVPQPMQMRFHAAARECDYADGPTQAGIGGARGPGKSHCVFAQTALDDCQRVPGLKALYLRKVAKNAREQFEDLRRSVLRSVPHNYNRGEGVLTFDNTSRIITGHFRHEGEIDQYLGIEYDLIVIEEATTLTLSKYRALRDSNRTSKPGWRPRIYSSTNPGGVGHTWYKVLFIIPARSGKETDTRFIFGTVDDNAFVDPDYKKKLEENTGWKLRAYRFGDWDIAAGQYFTTWRQSAHVCKPFEIPKNYLKWGSLDYGFTHPTVAYLLAEGDGRKYIVGEHYAAKKLPPFHASSIKAMLERCSVTLDGLWTFVAGDDVFSKKGDSQGKTIADQYKENGIKLKEADDDRINGAAEFLELLGDVDAGIEPKIQIFETCPRLIECIPAMQHDPNRPEDVLKVDVDDDGNGGDDPYDSARYGVMARRRKSETKVFRR